MVCKTLPLVAGMLARVMSRHTSLSTSSSPGALHINGSRVPCTSRPRHVVTVTKMMQEFEKGSQAAVSTVGV